MAPICTASQVNLLIYHYLKESGFHHACFSLRHEARLDEDPLSKEAVIEAGQLVKYLQKGLLYMTVEAHVNSDGTEKPCSAPFSLIGPPHICDGVPRPIPSKEPSPPRRLTPSPPPQPMASTKVEIAVQTQASRTSQSRDSSMDPVNISETPVQSNGVLGRRDSENSSSNVASSSKSKLDSVSTTEGGTEVIGKRKGGGSKLAKADKRVKRTTTPLLNGGREASEEVGEEPENTSNTPVASSKKSKKVTSATKDTSGSNSNGTAKNGKGTNANAYIPPLTGKAKGKEVASDKVAKLKGHSAEVFLSAWNPTVPGLLASGAGDATVRIWDLGSAIQSDELEGADSTVPAVCRHLPSNHAKDVSALSWNPDGTLLASGSYDGILRLWTPQGDLHLVMSMHQGPIFAVRWNRKGNYILSGSADGTAIVWDLGSGKVRQQFSLHSDSVLDIDWLTGSMNLKGSNVSTAADGTLATCSADNSINLLRLGESKPVKILRGHTDEVNAIRFDPTGTLLASVSDDMTARVWNLNAILGSNYIGISAGSNGRNTNSRHQSSSKRNSATPRQSGGSTEQMDLDDDEGGENDSTSFDASSNHGVNNGSTVANNQICKFVLSGHKKDIFAIAWANHDIDSEDPRLLATASFDNTARIWNAEDGTCLRVFQEHTDSVYSVCFSPDRRFLVTGGMDHRLFISSVTTGEVALAYAGGGGIFDIAWHVGGGRKAVENTTSTGEKKLAGIKQESHSADPGESPGHEQGDESTAPRRHHLALSQANRTLTILDVGSYLDSPN
jgi:transducin (beta)-like 1